MQYPESQNVHEGKADFTKYDIHDLKISYSLIIILL